MRARTVLVAAALTAAAVAAGPASAEPEPGDVTEDGYTILGVDPSGDWGGGSGAEFGDAMGQDLVSASVRVAPEAEEPTLEFQVQLASLPPIGGMPEFTRYTVNLLVDGEHVELDGKFTNFSRGACDPTSGQCPPPRNPGVAPFSIRGNCEANEANVTVCEELALVHATFDAGAATITIPVPFELIAVADCTLVEPGGNLFGGSASAAPSAYFTSSAMPMDTMFMDAAFQVPAADGSACPAPSA